MASKDVPSGSYRKITLDEHSASDKLSTGVLTAPKNKDKDIDGICELQMDATNFAALKAKLQTALTEKLDSHTGHEAEHLDKAKQTVAQELVVASKALNSSKQVFEDLMKTYPLIEGEVGASLAKAMTRNDQDKLNAATKQIKDQLKKAKDTLDKLNGSLVSGGVFAKTDAAVETLKKSAVKVDTFLEEIDLSVVKPSIVGSLYTSGWRIKNRNLSGVEGTLLKVNAKKKEYTVSYTDSDGKTQTIVVSQKDLCQVNNDKNKKV